MRLAKADMRNACHRMQFESLRQVLGPAIEPDRFCIVIR
jgi:hypothetical protein